MEKTNIKSKDGRFLYKATCSQCGCDRGLTPKKSVIGLCRSCAAIQQRIIKPQTRTPESYEPSIKLKSKHYNVDFNDFQIFDCGVKKYRMLCISCGVDKGYHGLSASKRLCRKCMGIRTSGKTSKNIDWNVFRIINGIKKYKQKCLHCSEDVGFRELKQYDSPCKKCRKLGLQRIRPIRKKIKSSMKSSIYHRLKNRLFNKNKKKTFDMLSYTLDNLMKHLESKFYSNPETGEAMSWDNYGEWHIDHITPDSWFTYSSTEDQGFKDSWALENLQPLWAKDNLKKSNKYSG